MRRWQVFRMYCALAMLLVASTARALMAGAPPDSPAARVDPNTATSSWNGVGSVVVGSGSYSGVLIAPQYVLTAAHVVGSAAPSSVQFVLNVGGDQTHVLSARSITRYPSASFPYDDLAIIKLETAAPPGVSSYPIERRSILPGQQIVLVGYGGSGNGNIGVSVGGSRTVKRTGRNVVDFVQTTIDSSGRTSLFYLYDFDGPSGNGSFGGPTLGNALETLVAGSDSGSPAFIVDAQGIRLVGINTFVASEAAGEPIDYMFGNIGGGILLTRPEFLNWVDATLGPQPGAEDIPTLPEWAVIVAIVLVTVVAWRGGVTRTARS